MKQLLAELHTPDDIEVQTSEIRIEYDSGRYRTLLLHIYSGLIDRDTIGKTASSLAKRFPDALIAGTLSAGEIKSGELMEKGILVSAMLFEDTDIRITRFEQVRGREAETGRQIRELLDAIPDIRAAELLLPGTEFRTRALFEEMEQCAPHIQIFGGYAGAHDLSCTEHFVFNPDGIYEDSIIVITYAGKNFHIQMDKSVGWKTLGRPFKVTKADENRLIEIDNAPAVEVYEKYLQIDRNGNFAEDTFEFPLIAKVEDDELLRHTMLVEKDGTLDLAGYVTEGMDILLCYGNPSEIIEKVNERLAEINLFAPQAILLYSCSVRKAFWESFVNMEMEPFERIAKTSGFHTWGEVKRNPKTNRILEYNITLLSIAMREGEADTVPLPEIRVDDSVLKGQALLIKRLSQLVSATTSELQNAYDHLREMNRQLIEMTEHDALTGIFNRRKIENLIIEELDKSLNTEEPVSLIMVDIDHFKQVNDTYGHSIGDVVLKLVSGMLWEATAGIRYAAAGRWGGEEFFILLPRTGREQAHKFAENLRERIAHYEFPKVKHLTVSMGVITSVGTENRRELFTKVDDALYKAKETGRNRVIISS